MSRTLLLAADPGATCAARRTGERNHATSAAAITRAVTSTARRTIPVFVAVGRRACALVAFKARSLQVRLEPRDGALDLVALVRRPGEEMPFVLVHDELRFDPERFQRVPELV